MDSFDSQMKNSFLSLLFLTLILGACTPGVSPTDAPPAAPATVPSTTSTETVSDLPALPIPRFEKTLQTPHIDQPPDGAITTPAPTFEGCGYQWAQQDLPELSAEFQREIQSLQADAQANAYVFGEDCIYADGHKTFLAKETDFNITLRVNDLADESDLGEWIVKVMQVILNIPKEEIIGPRPGLVGIIFQAGNQNKGANFYIDRYQTLPSGLSNAEIYQALQSPQ